MLTRYQIESELSLAYLHAVAAKSGFSVDVPRIDNDSVDAVVSARGKLAVDSVKKSPRIEIQLKASINAVSNLHGTIPFQISLKNYDELRADTVLPRLLVLFSLPRDEMEWLVLHPDKLIMQKCAYFLNLKGMSEIADVDSPTVYIPIVNMLTPASLMNLMIKSSKLEDL